MDKKFLTDYMSDSRFNFQRLHTESGYYLFFVILVLDKSYLISTVKSYSFDVGQSEIICSGTIESLEAICKQYNLNYEVSHNVHIIGDYYINKHSIHFNNKFKGFQFKTHILSDNEKVIFHYDIDKLKDIQSLNTRYLVDTSMV